MRLSQLSGKEIIDLQNGERLGMIGQSDLMINEVTGAIESFILPATSFLGMGKKKGEIIIPWHAIRKIGSDMIIIELREREFVRE